MATTVVNQSRSGNKITYQSSSSSDVETTLDIPRVSNGISGWFVGIDYFQDAELTIPLNASGETTGTVEISFITEETLSDISITAIDITSPTNRRTEFLGNPVQIKIIPTLVPGSNFVRVRATGS